VPIPSVGQPFDPNLHHAIMREETNEVPENWILEELLKGYTYGDRLLRPAQVKVAVLKSDGKLDSEG
jgi:molecular chaperone GrpE